MKTRFVVASVVGWPINGSRGGRAGSHAPGLSAAVLDTLHLFRAVKMFCSENRRLRPDGALQAAQDLAAELNEVAA